MTTIRLDPDLLEALRQVKDTDGIPVTTQIEKAAREWLRNRGVTVKKPPRSPAGTRKRVPASKKPGNA